jgi:hypothetical protein
MQFGKTLVGAIIGAALGVVLLIAVYLLFGIDKMWMAVPVALLTGLGVRMVATTSGHPSYLRGAITVALAMGAYFGGLRISQVVATHRAETVSKANLHRAAAEEPGEPGDAKKEEPTADVPPVVAPPVMAAPTDGTMRRPAVQMSTRDFMWNFISLAVAALVAYELGRGSGGVPKGTIDAGPAPGGTHPDA